MVAGAGVQDGAWRTVSQAGRVVRRARGAAEPWLLRGFIREACQLGPALWVPPKLVLGPAEEGWGDSQSSPLKCELSATGPTLLGAQRHRGGWEGPRGMPENNRGLCWPRGSERRSQPSEGRGRHLFVLFSLKQVLSNLEFQEQFKVGRGGYFRYSCGSPLQAWGNLRIRAWTPGSQGKQDQTCHKVPWDIKDIPSPSTNMFIHATRVGPHTPRVPRGALLSPPHPDRQEPTLRAGKGLPGGRALYARGHLGGIRGSSSRCPATQAELPPCKLCNSWSLTPFTGPQG